MYDDMAFLQTLEKKGTWNNPLESEIGLPKPFSLTMIILLSVPSFHLQSHLFIYLFIYEWIHLVEKGNSFCIC